MTRVFVPAGISAVDWAATPVSVQALVHRLRAQVTALEAQVVTLSDRLRLHSRNSDRPPSTDRPHTPRSSPARRSRRRRGAQPGHPPTPRPLVSIDRVDSVVSCKPTTCLRCMASLSGEDPAPSRHQVFELPAKLVEITEYQVHTLCCADCGARCRGILPFHADPTGFGPRWTALLAFLAIRTKSSVRDIAVLLHEVFHVPMALGSVIACEQRVSEALEAPVAAAHAAAQAQPIAHVDETGWRENKQRAWLWVLATPMLVLLVIAAHRNRRVARTVLGDFAGIVITDRWSAYSDLPLERRQLCWAHLVRTWQRFVDRGGRDAEMGRELQRATRRMFKWWHWIETGRRTRRWFEAKMPALQREVEGVLERGACWGSAKTAATCRAIQRVAPALWTFVRVRGVPPTNNFGEQQIRLGVVLRKIRYGTDSARGSRFVERMLSVVQTLTLQGRNILDFVTEALVAFKTGAPAPSLIPAPS